ncbi:MAG: serine/threonine-protein kinase HipA, partial [Cryomorphaceae bacterium]
MIAQIKLWGTTVAAASLDEIGVCEFEYDADFQKSGIEVSPIMMPLSGEIYRFAGLPRDTFYGLPGLLADVLPDKFGNALIDAWLATQGRAADSFNVIERLCYSGTRGMGALEFEPATSPASAKSAESLEVARLVDLASEVLSNRERLHTRFGPDDAAALSDILRVGTSAGGARAKAVIAWNPETKEVRSGQVDTEYQTGFSHWLLKFDGVKSNKDKELDAPRGYPALEYAYSLMAKAANIDMMPCDLLEE